MAAGESRDLERRISQVKKSLGRLKLEQQLDDLVLIIHRPGWTTPAELKLVLGLLQGLDNQINALGQLGDALVSGSKAVGR